MGTSGDYIRSSLSVTPSPCSDDFQLLRGSMRADNYYLSFPKDPIYMKLLVYGSLALEIIQTILVTRDTYATFTTGYGNFFTLNELHFLWLTLPIFGGVGELNN